MEASFETESGSHRMMPTVAEGDPTWEPERGVELVTQTHCVARRATPWTSRRARVGLRRGPF